MLKAFFLGFLIFLTACAHPGEDIKYGIQKSHISYVPARIAVLTCRQWPNGARYKAQPLSNAIKGEMEELCKRFDKFVIDGFEGQPYMRGLSPGVVNKLLKRNEKLDLLDQFPEHWRHLAEDCSECEIPPAFYTLSITKRANWQVWLNELSRNVRNADAVLIPMVTYALEGDFDDRGVRTLVKQAGVTLFLVDTNNAFLLWAGGREASVTTRVIERENVKKELAPPQWETLYDRLFVDDIWKDFPGRQSFH